VFCLTNIDNLTFFVFKKVTTTRFWDILEFFGQHYHKYTCFLVKLQQKQLFIGMKIIITESQYRFLVENTQEIDQILDKMSENGYENLSNDEKMTLKDYSEWLNKGEKGEFTPQNTPKNTDFEGKMGENWTRTLQDGSEFTFQFDYDEIENDVELYFGVVKWGGTEWVGCIVAEKDGSLALLDFVEDTGDYETYDNTQISSKFEPKTHRYLNQELGKLEDEVDYYIEEVIIPELRD
jgi:hypothetical protein